MIESNTGDKHKNENAFSQTTVLTVGYVVIAIVTLVMVARIVLQSMRPKRLVPEDFCILFAYVCFVSQCALYITMAPIRDRLTSVATGKLPPYPSLKEDTQFIGKLYVPAFLFFWTILWSVKFSLLFLYRKMCIGLSNVYSKIWWFLVVFCGISLVGNYTAFLTSCDRVDSFWKAQDGCNDRGPQLLSIWYSYAADTTTNIMLIALPLHLTWDLQMPRRQKVALLILFTSGVICIAAATLRASQVTANTLRTNSTMDGTWLGVWGMIETAIGVVIGLCPSFAVLIRARRNTTKRTPYNGHGYMKQDGQGFQLQTIGGSGGLGNRSKSRPTDTWIDMHDSQEELAKKTECVSISTSMHPNEECVATAK